jgi:hypothetical protein
MAKKARMGKVDRSDPRKNKSLAIRTVLKRLPGAKAKEVTHAVQKEFGHKVSQNMVYMVKTKSNMAADGRPRKSKNAPPDTPMTTAAAWIEAIKIGGNLLKATGSVANATALLRALDR